MRITSPRSRGCGSLLCLLAAAALLAAGGAAPVAAETRVVIIAGKGGSEAYTERFSRLALQLHDALITQHHFAPRQIMLFAESATRLPATTQPGRAQDIETAFAELATTLQRDDLLTIVLFGHGSDDGAFAKFNLEGPDLRDLDFGRLLSQLPCQRQVLVNTTAASAGFLAKLSRNDRILITATRSAEEKYLTAFPEFFVEAFVSPAEADLDKDQKLSLLEAFDFARDRVVRFYEEANRLRPEHPLLDDNGDGVGSEMPGLTAAAATSVQRPDGQLAAQTFLVPETATPAPALITAAAGGSSLAIAKQKLLAEIEALKARKESLSAAEYERQIETLFIQLAKLNREIRAGK
ncbi:hypothetical protein L6R21_04025 [bacterium]|nr:hypothetical protein [bacterium]